MRRGSEVNIDQKTNYSVSVPGDQKEFRAQTYPIVDVRSRVCDFGPGKALSKGVPSGFALPNYEVNL